jgi:hypothetical protein
VDVAFLRLTKGVKAAAKKRRCQWLKSKRARFKALKPRAGTCTKPVWLKAKGTRRWSFRLKRRLPKGRYVVYARAVNRAGVWDARFSPKRGNKRRFKVR